MDFQDLRRRLEVKDKDHPDLEAAFEMFETEKGSGRITPVSLWRTLTRHGDSTTYSECMAMVEAFDTNRDGELDYDEFHEMMTVTSSKKGKLILNLEDVRKLLRISRLEKVKSRLRQMEQDHILQSELIRICSEACNCPSNQSLEFAKILDESGTVVILGDVVFLRPDQLVRAVQGLLPLAFASPTTDPRVTELAEMENQKACIDKKAESLARRELWCVLAYIVIQTAAVMILTYYEKLSWNVMEPICYCMTYVYMIGRLLFFLTTSTEPSFEGLLQGRFFSKQKQLMKLQNFNLERYNELLTAGLPPSPHSSESAAPPHTSPSRRAQKKLKKNE